MAVIVNAKEARGTDAGKIGKDELGETEYEVVRIKRKSREIAVREQLKIQKAVDEQLKRTEEERLIRQGKDKLQKLLLDFSLNLILLEVSKFCTTSYVVELLN